MADQGERFRVFWVDTDTGGRIHVTAAFRWAEATETSLYRRLGLLRGERGNSRCARSKPACPRLVNTSKWGASTR
jgi:hypothetical protein